MYKSLHDDVSINLHTTAVWLGGSEWLDTYSVVGSQLCNINRLSGNTEMIPKFIVLNLVTRIASSIFVSLKWKKINIAKLS